MAMMLGNGYNTYCTTPYTNVFLGLYAAAFVLYIINTANTKNNTMALHLANTIVNNGMLNTLLQICAPHNSTSKNYIDRRSLLRCIIRLD